MRAGEIQPNKLVIFDIDDTLVRTDTKVGVVKDGKVTGDSCSIDRPASSVRIIRGKVNLRIGSGGKAATKHVGLVKNRQVGVVAGSKSREV